MMTARGAEGENQVGGGLRAEKGDYSLRQLPERKKRVRREMSSGKKASD